MHQYLEDYNEDNIVQMGSSHNHNRYEMKCDKHLHRLHQRLLLSSVDHHRQIFLGELRKDPYSLKHTKLSIFC